MHASANEEHRGISAQIIKGAQNRGRRTSRGHKNTPQMKWAAFHLRRSGMNRLSEAVLAKPQRDVA